MSHTQRRGGGVHRMFGLFLVMWLSLIVTPGVKAIIMPKVFQVPSVVRLPACAADIALSQQSRFASGHVDVHASWALC